MERKLFPWGGHELSDEEHEDSSVIEALITLYGLGYTYSGKKFKVFNMPFFCTNEMSIKETLDFLLTFESSYANEVWFQQSHIEGRKKLMGERLSSGDGE